MSGYGELADRCLNIDSDMVWESRVSRIEAILDEVFRTLGLVTLDMKDAGMTASFDMNTREALEKDWLIMLRASPLAKPKEDTP